MAGFSFKSKRGGAAKAAFGVDMRLKEWFFDRKNLEFAIDKAESKAMSRVGAFVRRRARSLQRRRKKSSPAGQPPSVHSSDKTATLKNIVFGYDARIHGVVAGPVKLNKIQRLNGKLLAGTVPQLQEFGGQAGIREFYNPVTKRWVAATFRSKRLGSQFRQRIRRTSYAPHPFMGPALDAEVEAGTIPMAWKGRVAA